MKNLENRLQLIAGQMSEGVDGTRTITQLEGDVLRAIGGGGSGIGGGRGRGGSKKPKPPGRGGSKRPNPPPRGGGSRRR